jgi:thiamine pyrophosphate-dependent acetolactate synthase large subunit-like protein
VAIELLLEALQEPLRIGSRNSQVKEITDIRKASLAPTREIGHQHLRVLETIRKAMPGGSMLFGDMAQVVYYGCVVYPCSSPKEWQFVGGFGTLGSALPMAIGAKLGNPDRAIAVLVGDYGLLFSMQELMVAVEWKLSLPIIVWDNEGLGEIRDAMDAMEIERVGVETSSPDFESLARALRCHSRTPLSLLEVEREIRAALVADLPTIIVVREGANYLTTANEP